MDAVQHFVRARPAFARLADILIAGGVRQDVILAALAAAAAIPQPVAFGGHAAPAPARPSREAVSVMWDRAMTKAVAAAGGGVAASRAR